MIMKKLDPVVIIVDILLLIGCGCMFLYGRMSAHSLFIVGIVLIVFLVIYLYVTNYKDNHYGGKFHQDFQAVVIPLLICYIQNKEGDYMGGLCVLLLMMFCVGWILCVFFLSMLIPLLIIYNGIVGIVCIILYFVLRKKSVFTKYTEVYKHVLSVILKYVP